MKKKEKEIIAEIRTLLEKSERPFFMFDKDPDGLCAYLLLKKFYKKGSFAIIRNAPEVGSEWVARIKKETDLVVILDKPLVSPEFLQHVKQPIIWIDHHEPQKTYNAVYYNPRNYGEDYVPTTECCYRITKENEWIAGVGIIEDWKVPPFLTKLIKAYPKLIKKTNHPAEIRYDMPFGKIGSIFNAALKGDLGESIGYIKQLEKIETPYDLLEKKESFHNILEQYETVENEYRPLYKKALLEAKKNKHFLVFLYDSSGKYSHTGSLADELTYRFPEKLVLVGREKDGIYRMSIRVSKGNIPVILEKIFEGTTGYGGGHPQSCGASISVGEFDEFLNDLKKEWITQIEQLK